MRATVPRSNRNGMKNKLLRTQIVCNVFGTTSSERRIKKGKGKECWALQTKESGQKLDEGFKRGMPQILAKRPSFLVLFCFVFCFPFYSKCTLYNENFK